MTTQKTTGNTKGRAHEVQISLQNNIVPLHAALTAVLPAPGIIKFRTENDKKPRNFMPPNSKCWC